MLTNKNERQESPQCPRHEETNGSAISKLDEWDNPLPDRHTLEWARSSLSDILERQPLVVGAIGLAIGATVAGAFQTSEKLQSQLN
jgi:hypothetical protein